MKISSHTLVRNGQPFIGPVLRQVAPHVDQMIVTISEKSGDGTMKVLKQLKQEYAHIEIYTENVGIHRELTVERQKQVEKTKADWILFLDDDDYWPETEFMKMKEMLDDKMNGFAVKPYQLIDWRHHDYSWRYKWFTKFFRNQPGIHYRKPWPKDLIYLDDQWLFWKKTNTVPRANPYFIHLQNLKGYSFRQHLDTDYYRKNAVRGGGTVGRGLALPYNVQLEVDKIYEQIRH